MNEIRLPQLGQEVEEASVIEWFAEEGDPVEKGDPLFSVQTDKAEVECDASAGGVLRKILVELDEVVPVLTVIALVGEAGEPIPNLEQYKRQTQAVGEDPAVATAVTAAGSAGPKHRLDDSGAFVSPRAGATARQLGVNPQAVTGTGVGGRILAEDVAAFVDSTFSAAAQRLTAPASAARGRSTPLTPMRKAVAERMSRSKFSTPHFYLTVEVDMTQAIAFREGLQDYTPTFNDLVMAAVRTAIGKCPAVNARWTNGAIIELTDVHIGFAVALPEGLLVPVVRDAGSKSLREIHETCKTLAEKAKNGRLSTAEYSGGTFTVSNLGAFGVDAFTAIINPPESAILAVGRIQKRPAVVDDRIEARPLMNLTLSSDHRVIDGAAAARFMDELRQALENAVFES